MTPDILPVGNLSTRRFLYLSEGSNLLDDGSFETTGWWQDWHWRGYAH